MQFNWLPVREDFDNALREVKTLSAADAARRLRDLATSRLDLTQTAKLDRALLNALKSHGNLPGLEPLRLAILSSATTSHLPPGIRVAGLRRGLAIEIYEAPYGMYWQELKLTRELRPPHLRPASHPPHTRRPPPRRRRRRYRRLRPRTPAIMLARGALHVPLPGHSANRHARPAHTHGPRTGRTTCRRHPLQSSTKSIAASRNSPLTNPSISWPYDRIIDDGLSAWHDPGLWHHAKQELLPNRSPLR